MKVHSVTRRNAQFTRRQCNRAKLSPQIHFSAEGLKTWSCVCKLEKKEI